MPAPQFKEFLNALLPVAEELGDKTADVIVEQTAELDIELRTVFNNGKVTRRVILGVPAEK